jgi:hypothetical protein
MAEVRCGSRLFLKILDDGDLEVACRDCRTEARRRNPDVVLVLHRFSPATGKLLGTRELTLVKR